jgi:hypothetical protein
MSAFEGIGADRLEGLLRGEEPRTQAEERHVALFAELRGGALHAPEALRDRVLASAPAARRSFALRRPPRRLVLVAVPLALAAGVGAAVVHGIVGSGSSFSNDRLAGQVAAAPAPARHAVTHGRAFPATTTAAAGSSAGQSLRQLAPNVPAPLATSGRLVHADAQLSVQEDSASKLSSATSQATQIVGSLGGYAQSVRYSTAHDGSGSAFLDLRVPVGNVQKAVNKLSALGTLLDEQISQQDLEQQLTKQTNQISSLKRTVAAYERALQDPSLPAAQRVILQVRLANAKRALTQTRQARSGTISSAATADVSLTLTTKNGVAAIPPRRGRLGRMFHGAVGFLGLEAIIVLYALVVLSPFIVLGGLGWALWRERRRREERRLLSA